MVGSLERRVSVVLPGSAAAALEVLAAVAGVLVLRTDLVAGVLVLPQVDGFLGLLQSLQDIRNQQVTIVGLRTNLSQLRDSLREDLTQIPDDAEIIIRDRLQVAQARAGVVECRKSLTQQSGGVPAEIRLLQTYTGAAAGSCACTSKIP